MSIYKKYSLLLVILTSFDVQAVSLTEPGNGISAPAYATDNVTAAFQNSGFGMTADYSSGAIQMFSNGIPTLGVVYSSQVFAAQLGAAFASGYSSVAPGIGFQIPSLGLRLGVLTNLQFNSFQWNNSRLYANYSFSNQWSIGLRTGIAVVTNVIDEIGIGIGKSWGAIQSAIDLQADGTLGTFRLMPGVGIRLGKFEATLTGSLARSSNWTFYPDRIKTMVAFHLNQLGFIRAYYETPRAGGLGVGLTF